MTNFFGYSFDTPWFFTNYSFLVVLGFFLLVYSLLYNKDLLRKLYLIIFSLFFYYKSSGPFLIIFILLILGDYNFAKYIERIKSTRARKFLLVFSILISLSFLLYFKYSGFFLMNVNELFSMNFVIEKLFLPIGISFYTFQSISYIVDVYQGKIKSSSNFVDYAFYMTFFPHLVAGPIVRASDFIPQINNPLQIDRALLKTALFRIVLGFSKKLIIADFLGKFVDIVHSNPKLYSGVENLISMYAYSFQIYFDFSGYSDIAIGIALLMGYKLNENFDRPYASQNITDFWRRWHISLSTWLRDYIYIPLGGSRTGKFNTYLFLMITMTVGGFWHGASWNFVLWGVLHGVALIVHKLISSTKPKAVPKKTPIVLKCINLFVTFNFVSILWILFRAQSFDDSISSIRKIALDIRFSDFVGFYFARKEVLFMLLAAVLLVFLNKSIKLFLERIFVKTPLLVILIFLILFLQLALQIKSTDIAPFIYFQF